MANGKTVLRSKDVAHILDMSPDDVIELARSGKIKATKKGRFWRFQERDITAYVRKQERENVA
jgi:excisionase family DNA binding protein